jgi:hypothetical protein
MRQSWVNAAAGETKTTKNHPKVCGHPWPVDGEFIEGTHWTPARYDKFALWYSDVRDALKRFVYGAARHRQVLIDAYHAREVCRAIRLRGDFSLTQAQMFPPTALTALEEEKIEAKVANCENCRLHLALKAGTNDPDALMRWVTGSVRLMRRLAVAGFIPLPYADTLP